MNENLVVRRAVLDDAEDIARVHTRSWQFAYQGILSNDYLDALRWETRFEMWNRRLGDTQSTSNNVFVSTEADRRVTGFASIGEVRDDDLTSRKFFELYAIYVAPEFWDLGVGRALWDIALASLPSGTPGVSLWVLTENERGRRFYERRGFESDGTSRIEQIGGRALEELRYFRPSELKAL